MRNFLEVSIAIILAVVVGFIFLSSFFWVVDLLIYNQTNLFTLIHTITSMFQYSGLDAVLGICSILGLSIGCFGLFFLIIPGTATLTEKIFKK